MQAFGSTPLQSSLIISWLTFCVLCIACCISNFSWGILLCLFYTCFRNSIFRLFWMHSCLSCRSFHFVTIAFFRLLNQYKMDMYLKVKRRVAQCWSEDKITQAYKRIKSQSPTSRPKQRQRLYMFKVFIEYPKNLGSGCISMFSVNLTFDKTFMMQFCYVNTV